MSPHPRPILKRISSSTKQTTHALPFATCASILSPRVHFPPTPSMVASTHPVHSPQTYDRKPIVVSPNSCALPDRGERKLYSPPTEFEVERRDRSRSRRSSKLEHVKGSYFHPRAYEACEPEPLDVDDACLSPPLLVRDTSTSDEYDSDSSDEEPVTTPPDPKFAAVTIADVTLSATLPTRYSRACAQGPDAQVQGKSVEEQRPLLVRSSKRPSIRFGPQEYPAIVDEGCLGGF